MARIGIFNRKKVTAFKKGNKLQSSTSCKSGSVNSTSIDNASTGDSSEPIVATAHVCQGLFNGSENVLNLGDSSIIVSLTNVWKFDPTSNIIPYDFGNGLWFRFFLILQQSIEINLLIATRLAVQNNIIVDAIDIDIDDIDDIENCEMYE